MSNLVEIADECGSEGEFISRGLEKGEQLCTALGGVAGIMRYSAGV